MINLKNIKPLYIYGFGIILAALVFIFLSQQDSADNIKNPGITANQNMPNDSIHKGLNNSVQPPSKNNVMADVMQHLAMLKKAADESPNDTIKIKEYADFLSAAHKPDEALIYYNKILKVNPRRTDILFSVAFIHYNEKNFEEAEKCLNKVLSYDKGNLTAFYNLGAIAASKGDKNKAKEIWSKLVKEHPKTQIAELAQKSLNEI